MSDLRKLDKARRIARERGKPYMVREDEAYQAFVLVRWAHDHGMSNKAIADQVGVSESNISQMVNGKRYASREDVPVTEMWRTTYEKIMRLQLDVPVRNGARLPVTGTRRRLQALSVSGFPQGWLACELGVAKPCIWRICNSDRSKYVFFNTHRDVVNLYAKYEMENPADHGLHSYQVTRASNEARGKGYAPPGCWDSDTIDNPDTFPEWTGACGTYKGANLHRKYNIPLCNPCKAARNERREAIGYASRGTRG